MSKIISKSIKFLILLVVYSAALYLSYNVGMTDYAYILTISITWIAIVQCLDQKLSNSEKIISTIVLMLTTLLAQLGKIGIFSAIMSSVGILIAEMIYYVLISETTEMSRIPRTLRTVILLALSFLVAFIIESIADRLIMGLSEFFVQDGSNSTGISSQYALSTFIYNIAYSIPICINILLTAYILGKSDVSSFNDFNAMIVIVIIPLFFFIYNNILSDQYVKAGKDFISAFDSYESYITPKQYANVLDTITLGKVQNDEKDNISYYTNNYFYNAPYSIECVVYNYRTQMDKYLNTTKARYNKKEIETIRILTTNVLSDTEAAVESCKNNSIYMWILYIIDSFIILGSYIVYKNANKQQLTNV